MYTHRTLEDQTLVMTHLHDFKNKSRGWKTNKMKRLVKGNWDHMIWEYNISYWYLLKVHMLLFCWYSSFDNDDIHLNWKSMEPLEKKGSNWNTEKSRYNFFKTLLPSVLYVHYLFYSVETLSLFISRPTSDFQFFSVVYINS